MFNYFSGTVSSYFYAHDDLITAVMFKDDILITCSLDYMIKFWDLKSGQMKEPWKVSYDHEGKILSADLHPSQDEMVSVDSSGEVIGRKLKTPDTLTYQLSPPLAPGD